MRTQQNASQRPWRLRAGVLGQLEADVSGMPVELGGRMPRRLFAALVMRAGEPVPMSSLVDALWADRAPRTAVKTVQTYVTRLRAAVDATAEPAGSRPGGAAIETTRHGYRLRVDADKVDAVVFTDLVTRARGAVDGGRPREAEELLAKAFPMWRGEPYGEFRDLSFFAPEAARLSEMRLIGIEAHVDSAEMVGHHATAVARATAACTEFPLHERYWGQLMIALYRSGRATEALGAYHRLRRHLAEEVGSDPAPDLRRLEQRVLHQDPSLDAPVSAGAVRA